MSLQGGYASWLLARFRQMEEQDAAVDKAKEVERSLHKKFRKNIWSKFTKAVTQYELVKPGDKIAVCISGGKRFDVDGEMLSGLETFQQV